MLGWTCNILNSCIIETVDGQDTKQCTSCDKIQIDLLIPLVIFILCFLLSLGVNIYQRHLIQNYKKLSGGDYEVPEKAKADQTIKSGMYTYSFS